MVTNAMTHSVHFIICRTPVYLIKLKPFSTFQTSSDIITEVVRDIMENKKQGGFLESMKILIISHDISFHKMYSIIRYFKI